MSFAATDLPMLLSLFVDGAMVGGAAIATSYLIGIALGLAYKIMSR